MKPSARIVLALTLILVGGLAVWRWQDATVPVDAGPAADPSEAAATPPDPETPESAPETAAEAEVPKEFAPAPKPAMPPFRAPPAQRADDAKRLDSEPDLPAFAAELAARANAGDADAAQMLAGIYDTCGEAAAIASKPDFLASFVRLMSAMGTDAAQIDALVAAANLVTTRCAGFPTRSPEDWTALAKAWRNLAAEHGHPGARLQTRPSIRPADSPQAIAERARARAAGVELLEARDVMDLIRYASELSRLSRYDYSGFLIAACSMLDGCMEDPTAYALRSSTTPFQAPRNDSFSLIAWLSPRARVIAEGQSAEIVRLWRAGQFRELLADPAHDAPGGGG